LPEIQRALRHRSLSSTSCYLVADANDVDRARAKAIGGACEAVAQAAPLTLEDVQGEMQRLARLAATTQAEGEKRIGRVAMAV